MPKDDSIGPTLTSPASNHFPFAWSRSGSPTGLTTSNDGWAIELQLRTAQAHHKWYDLLT